MKTLKLYSQTLILLLILVFVTSCGSHSKKDQYAAGGTLVGAGTGAVVGRQMGSSGAGAAIGAAGGAATGAVIGDAVDEEKTYEEKVLIQQEIIRRQQEMIERQNREIQMLKRQQFYNESLRRYE